MNQQNIQIIRHRILSQIYSKLWKMKQIINAEVKENYKPHPKDIPIHIVAGGIWR